MGKPKAKPAEPLTQVWLVWNGYYDPTLENVCASQAGAERKAHELRKSYGGGNTAAEHVSVDSWVVEP